MPTAASRRTAFKALHEKGRAFLMPNPFDIGSARILDGLRFDAMATSSAGYAWTQGVRDAEGLISRDAALAHAADIIGACGVPVNGDLENGFGDAPEEVVETVKGAIEVGLAGCSIEDYTTDPKNPYYSLELAVERIKAAVDAKNAIAPDFVLTARSEGPVKTDHELEETIKRLNAFVEAGADCVYAPQLKDKDQIVHVLSKVNAPLNILAGRKNFHLTRKELGDLGVTRVSIGAGLARIAYGAFIAAAEDMKDGGSFGSFDRADSVADSTVDFESFMKARP
ncbi:isocitrate lyase/phosphoenolpyruvate mutase family protein [Roseibium porphyridii]|uniref:Isocitrate lyase/phosphoenolpyruvate mutase family protein n=1 Tax=Roseibium porphyridii TaxID=2866279 RepID=A0ABY8F4B0_9HYPH|nr:MULTISPECIES: isocitrate lyase/phosphoenolpyruvate mutase family protein [Stappiaceae]QFT29068.1 Carboxyvinyl-carboxyphosphonate phosphorylmutase [Labrenzia sp. THAF82]WFE90066.1 isocitrate lyase/phosphoenolpyruvate mutase family protein [Roseibium sp. KMA01]